MDRSHSAGPASPPLQLQAGLRVDVPTAADIQAISQALLLLVRASETITNETADRQPPAGSIASELWQGAEPQFAIDGFLLMQYANMSAFDHVRGFVALLRTPTVRSTALATVARGALESLARTWHLLQRPESEQFLHTVLSFLRSDLRYSELLEEPIWNRNGDPVDAAEQRRFYLAELTRLGLPAPSKIDLSDLVAGLLDAATGEDDGRLRYSALSSIAHGQRIGINTFVATNETGLIVGLRAPRNVVADMVGQLVATLHETTADLCRFFGDQPRHIDLLRASSQRAAAALDPLSEAIWPSKDKATQ
ncbi:MULTISPECIES: hypothetical protein [unclassified Curtobacterium]|uniref:hypothetical protein n=1 Tax=unclassified Curtobacterium TaxID=257496 RepID=UPI0011B46590|nr:MULTISPECIES: hypothetical protein [unclassified Curtobacterium]WIB33219.1 hypothetical protein DEJ20_01800 [Curtobacterium sp. MCSS17_005]